ncbi:MAG: sialidase family protein, partial [Bacteroidota bacterium]
MPDSKRRYIGTPGIVALTFDVLVATHDLFGEDTQENETHVYRSENSGVTWNHVASIVGQWWSTLFVHGGALYLIGVDRAYGNVVVRRSTDGGNTWASSSDGILPKGRYHSSATAVVEHAGYLWRAVELRPGEDKYDLESWLLVAPVGSDLLRPGSWEIAGTMAPPENVRWLEGNAVVTPASEVATMLRVRPDQGREQAAVLCDGDVQLVDLPGGAKKFTVRLDSVTGRYLALTNPSLPGGYPGEPDLARIRNRLWLYSSSDLTTWVAEGEVIGHENWRHIGFQYADWVRVGNQLAIVVRTAFRDPTVPTLSAMASNALT